MGSDHFITAKVHSQYRSMMSPWRAPMPLPIPLEEEPITRYTSAMLPDVSQWILLAGSDDDVV
jgi:hypothetical protein